MATTDLSKSTKLSDDAEGDALSIHFGKPQPADDSDLTDEGVVIRLRDGRIVGLTILNATKKVLV